MLDFKIIHVGRYTQPETADYNSNWVCILFIVEGIHSMRIDSIDIALPNHCLMLFPAGSRVQFQANHHRENWALLLESDMFRTGLGPEDPEVQIDGLWTKLNGITVVTNEHVSGWESELIRIRDAFAQPTLLHQFRAKLGVMNILRYVIDRQGDTLRMSSAGKLKSMLDEGRGSEQTLEQLSRKCGYSADHLRILFREEFGITPLDYHNRTRMTKAMSLIDNSDLKVKEIAEKSGFVQVSHFCVMFKKTFNMTPTEAIKKLRHK